MTNHTTTDTRRRLGGECTVASKGRWGPISQSHLLRRRTGPEGVIGAEGPTLGVERQRHPRAGGDFPYRTAPGSAERGGRGWLRLLPWLVGRADGVGGRRGRPRRALALSGDMAAARRGGGGDSRAGFRRDAGEPGPAVPQGLIRAARKSGQLNLAGRDLSEGESDSLGLRGRCGGPGVSRRREGDRRIPPPLCAGARPCLSPRGRHAAWSTRLSGLGRWVPQGRAGRAAPVWRPCHGTQGECFTLGPGCPPCGL